MFRSRSDRRGETPDERTLAARNALTQAFLALDDEQRSIASAVGAATDLGTGSRLAPTWADVAAAADQATEAYLAAIGRFPLDGTGPVGGARTADERALGEIERARESIRSFHTRHSRVLDEAKLTLDGLPRTLQLARQALSQAGEAVRWAEQSGVRSRRATDLLAEAEQAAAQIDASVGLRQRRDAAARVLELARSARSRAEEAPRTAASVRSALTSIPTRRSAADTKAEQIGPMLSALRREFTDPCSRDLNGAPSTIGQALAAADDAIAMAGRLATAGDWDDAADQVAAARSALGRAERQHEAVAGRLTDLRAVRADPERFAADTAFVLRDAQRLVVDRDLVARFGPVLDAQAVRLQNARDRLLAMRPDHWLYLSELRGITERVREVVAKVRDTARPDP